MRWQYRYIAIAWSGKKEKICRKMEVKERRKQIKERKKRKGKKGRAKL